MKRWFFAALFVLADAKALKVMLFTVTILTEMRFAFLVHFTRNYINEERRHLPSCQDKQYKKRSFKISNMFQT